jgi:hypothetical protein
VGKKLKLELRAAAVGEFGSKAMKVLSIRPCPGEVHVEAKCSVEPGDCFSAIRISDQYGFIDQVFPIEMDLVQDLERFILFSIAVAGHDADNTHKALRKFLYKINALKRNSPFKVL